MYKISVSEEQFITTTDAIRQQWLDMAREFASNSNIDWEFRYRWMTMQPENFMLAKLKYHKILSAMKVVKL